MRSCSRCGRMLEDFDVGGDGICFNCEASSGHGSGTDVPCQRCGMYLPSHELRMWNSRLYCSYCIMDIMDEENRMRKGEQALERKPESEVLDQDSGKRPERCNRCGRTAENLYSSQGMRLCSQCYSEGGAMGGRPEGGSAGGVAQIVSKVFGTHENQKENKPKPKTNLAQKIVFDPATRKMVVKNFEEEKPPEKRTSGEFGRGGRGILSSLKRKFGKKD